MKWKKLKAINYPNPFKDWTTIVFTSKKEWVRVSVYDVLGNELRVVAEGKFSAGEHKIKVETRDLPAGNYYYRIVTKDRQKTRSMVKS